MNRSLLFFAALASIVVLRAQAPAESPDGSAKKAASIAEGRGLYNGACTSCHGVNGNDGPAGPGLAVAGHSYGRGSNSDADMFDAIKNGIAGTAMPAQGAKLNDDQIWKIIDYVQALRGTAIDAPLPGDAAHGEQVYLGKGQCDTCHMMHGKGSVIGPDLSNIAGVRKASAIIDALTREKHRVFGSGGAQPHALPLLEQYPVAVVTLADGRTVRGVLRNEDNFSIQMIGLDQRLHLFDRGEVKSVVHENRSLMPTDYDKRLAKDEFDDLVAYLTRQGVSGMGAKTSE